MPRHKPPREQRIARIARKLAARYLRQRHGVWKADGAGKGAGRRPFEVRGRRPRLKKLIAYDLETTRIEAGTPSPLYITAFCDSWQASMPITDFKHLGLILTTRFLTPEFAGSRFVAWNGNNYDVFFVARALLALGSDADSAYILRPYLTRGKALRGMMVIARDDPRQKWEFLDGLAMTGLGSTSLRSLKKFLDVFAPEYTKLQAPDWETETFDAGNAEHVAYAERDSEGLYYGLRAFEAITLEHFNLPLQPTIGNMGIKVFQAHLPEETAVWEPSYNALRYIRDYVMRGGYCFSVRRYHGPIWKYDINQAYAAAMREAWLPAGSLVHCRKVHPYALTGIYRIRATNPRNTIPFYYRGLDRVAVFGVNEIAETWITSIELAQLRAEHWKIEVMEGYFWDDQFKMTAYVDKLENLRLTAPGGTNGAQGLIMKCVGNNSYGKTVEELDGVEIVMANECPEGFYEYQDADNDDEVRCLWFKFGKPVLRDYHQPQLGAFITAHVRMTVRRAALLAPLAWLYADTDCIAFSSPVKGLDIDARRYGAWKVEVEGDSYRIIAKKVYMSDDGTVKHAKGLNVKRLAESDFVNWFEGRPPIQTQVQRQNFVKFVTGFEMFAERTKTGENLTATKLRQAA